MIWSWCFPSILVDRVTLGPALLLNFSPFTYYQHYFIYIWGRNVQPFLSPRSPFIAAVILWAFFLKNLTFTRSIPFFDLLINFSGLFAAPHHLDVFLILLCVFTATAFVFPSFIFLPQHTTFLPSSPPPNTSPLPVDLSLSQPPLLFLTSLSQYVAFR